MSSLLQVTSPEPVSSTLMVVELLGAQLKAMQGSYPTWLWTVGWLSSMLTIDLLQKQGYPVVIYGDWS